MWHISKIIVVFFFLLLLLAFWTNLIVTSCSLMQCSLLLLFFKIQGRSYKSKPKSIWLIMIRDYSWLSLFASNIKRKGCGVLKSFLSFYIKFCNFFFPTCYLLMLDLRFKSLCLIFYFIGYKKGVNIVEEYDIQSLYRMFLKCYHLLHPMT